MVIKLYAIDERENMRKKRKIANEKKEKLTRK